MNKLSTFLITISLLISYASHSQSLDNLMFSASDDIVRLDFSSGTPVVNYTGVSNGFEAIAHYEDAAGDVLFWINSTGVYDKFYNLMPGSLGMFVSNSSAEVNIIPFPNDPDKFYIGYNAQLCSNLYYAIVDMTLSGGLGDVSSSNVLISSNEFSEGMETVRIPCTDNYYFVAYECGVGFWSFLVDDTGFDTTGTLIESEAGPTGFIGQAELDYHAGKLGMSYATNGNYYYVGDYSPATNTLSGSLNTITSPGTTVSSTFGIEFSPDASKVFVANWYSSSSSDDIYQIDLTTMTELNIWNSFSYLNTGAYNLGSGQIEMGPDGNLYIIGQSSNNIIKITDSNTATPTLSTISTTSQLGLGISDHIQSDILQPLDTANFQIICSSDSMSYHIEVDILNGVSPFTFTGLTGNFNNGTFVSDDIMNGDSYSLEISDALSCSNPISIDDSFICSTCFLSADIDVNDSTYCTSSFIDYPVWVVASGQSPYSLYYSIDNVSQPVIVSSSDSILVNITQDGLIEIDSLVDGACSLILADDFQINLEPEENAGIGTELIITNTDSSTFVLSDYVSGQSTTAGNWYDPDGNLLSLGAIDVVTAIEGDYYYVVNEDNLCPTDSTPVSVSVIEPLPLEVINIMNAFSPNGDGTNDIFSPFISNIIDPIEMYIYNRWGELIFYSNDSVSDGWDGMAHGKPAPIGAYAYILKTEEDLSIPKIYKGNVTLIR